MANEEPKVLCQTPTPGKAPTHIPTWKYDLIRTAILSVLPVSDQGIAFKKLPHLVERQLSPEEKHGLGSVAWHTTTVKLNLEVKGEIERIPDITPQHLRKVS